MTIEELEQERAVTINLYWKTSDHNEMRMFWNELQAIDDEIENRLKWAGYTLQELTEIVCESESESLWLEHEIDRRIKG